MAPNVVERYLVNVRDDRLSSHRQNHRYPTVRHRQQHAAFVRGSAGTVRVITAAAAIMIAGFAAFVPSTDVALKVIGMGIAAAILIDATVIRMPLLAAVMHLLAVSARSPACSTSGSPWQHPRGSALLGFVGTDATHLAEHLAAWPAFMPAA